MGSGTKFSLNSLIMLSPTSEIAVYPEIKPPPFKIHLRYTYILQNHL